MIVLVAVGAGVGVSVAVGGIGEDVAVGGGGVSDGMVTAGSRGLHAPRKRATKPRQINHPVCVRIFKNYSSWRDHRRLPSRIRIDDPVNITGHNL